MATITAAKVTDLGLSNSMTACATGSGGDDFVNTGVEFIRIQNTHATQTYTVKVKAQSQAFKHPTYGNLAKNHVYKTVAQPGSSGANSIFIGPFKPGSFNTSVNKVQVYYKQGNLSTDTTFDAGTDITGSHNLKIEVLYLEN